MCLFCGSYHRIVRPTEEAHGPPPGPAEVGAAGPGGLSRRRFALLLAGVGGTALVGGCQPGGIGAQLVSGEQVEQLGLESWQRIRAETPESTNRGYRQRVQQITNRTLRAAGENPQAWEAVVFQGDEANAFALPGNKIGVYEGMFRIAENDDQLAAVIGHEIGHNQAEHARERLGTATATQAGIQLVSAALQVGNIGYANEIAALLGAGAQFGVILPYGRNQELEADRIGLRNMAQAGYDPRAAVQLWENMGQAGGGRPPAFLSTHPGTEDRIRQLQELMPEALEIYQRSS